MVDNAKAYLESDEGQQFERGLQQEFLGNKQNAGPAGASAARDSSDPSQASSGGDAVGPGSGGQGEDSTSGMNSSACNASFDGIFMLKLAYAVPQSRLNESGTSDLEEVSEEASVMSDEKRQTSLEIRPQTTMLLAANSKRTMVPIRLPIVGGDYAS